MSKILPRTLAIKLIVFALVAGLLLGVMLDRKIFLAFRPPDNIREGAADSFRLMAEAWNTVNKNYVDRESLTNQKLCYGAIGGMVDALGDKGHTRFMTPDQVKQVKNVIKGQFVGIGIELQMNNNQPTVIAPLDDSPAREAGVRPGDVLLRVNDKDLKGLGLEEVVTLVQGAPGTIVRIEFRTSSTGVTRMLTLKRRNIAIHNVTWQRLPGTAIVHIRIASFSRGTNDDLKKALKDTLAAGVTRGLILDLRNDPGGLLEEAVAVASQFLSNRTVVRVRSSDKTVEELKTEVGGLAVATPLVVLVNGGTASAAEIVAGALQDGARAAILGEKTVGTGTVLRQFPLADGSALLLAAYEWLTPAGRVIWHRGIEPDVLVELKAGVRPIYPRNERDMTPRDLRASDDNQLLEALRVMEGDSVPPIRHTAISR